MRHRVVFEDAFSVSNVQTYLERLEWLTEHVGPGRYSIAHENKKGSAVLTYNFDDGGMAVLFKLTWA